MDPGHKRYILENIGRKSVEEISRDINVKERKIRKFLEQQKGRARPAHHDAPPGTSPTRRPIILSIVLIIVLGFMAYGNAVNGTFIWDDEALVRDNKYVTGLSYLPRVFTEDIGAGTGNKYHFYRPLQMVTYMMDHALWQFDARGYHLTSIIVHILAALALYSLVNTLFNDNLLSLITAGLFVVHPIHTEAVTYISGRPDPLALLFILLCFNLYIKHLSSKSAGALVLMALSYVCALLSRENSLILPVLLLLYHYTFREKIAVKEFFLISGLAAIYIVLRLTVLRSLLAGSIPASTLMQRLPGFFVAITNYIRLLFFPFNLHMEYGSRLFSFMDIKAVIGAGIILGILVYAFKRKKDSPLVFFGTTWFLAALLPVSNLYPINAYMAEHWLYLPSAGSFLVMAGFISWLYQKRGLKTPVMVVAAGLLGFYTYLTMQQNVRWREPISFFERTLKYAPDSWKAHYTLGNAYKDAERNEEAIASYKRAIEIKPDYANAHNNLGLAFRNLDRDQEAVTAFNNAIDLNPESSIAHNNLGIAYADAGRTEEAIAAFREAIKINPDDTEAYYNLGHIYASLSRHEEAIALYTKVVEIDPADSEAYVKLGNVYTAENMNREAISSYEKAIKIKSDYGEAYNNLAAVYFRIQQYDLAVEYCDRAKELGFANPSLLEALGPYRRAIKR